MKRDQKYDAEFSHLQPESRDTGWPRDLRRSFYLIGTSVFSCQWQSREGDTNAGDLRIDTAV